MSTNFICTNQNNWPNNFDQHKHRTICPGHRSMWSASVFTVSSSLSSSSALLLLTSMCGVRTSLVSTQRRAERRLAPLGRRTAATERRREVAWRHREASRRCWSPLGRRTAATERRGEASRRHWSPLGRRTDATERRGEEGGLRPLSAFTPSVHSVSVVHLSTRFSLP